MYFDDLGISWYPNPNAWDIPTCPMISAAGDRRPRGWIIPSPGGDVLLWANAGRWGHDADAWFILTSSLLILVNYNSLYYFIIFYISHLTEDFVCCYTLFCKISCLSPVHVSSFQSPWWCVVLWVVLLLGHHKASYIISQTMPHKWYVISLLL